MITGIVLAAGTSTRFGATKQVAELHGRPLAQHAVDALTAARMDEIVVVLGHDAELVRGALALPANARTVIAERYATGQAASRSTMDPVPRCSRGPSGARRWRSKGIPAPARS